MKVGAQDPAACHEWWTTPVDGLTALLDHIGLGKDEPTCYQ